MYKIVAKLLANRLKPIIPRLVNSQQKGFVYGQQIQEKNLGFKLGQEFVKHNKLDAFFLKLDFLKAYDRVENNFLWGTLEAMGLSPTVIQLVKGLSLQGTTRVHFNGIFTDAIKLGRGVKQGCLPSLPSRL
jgi:hypothetical protein